jgi:3-oxoacyl-[acyl-carrier protein] reductase
MTDNGVGQNLSGRLAVVTGGAQGIGRSIVEALAEAGARVVIADLNPENGQQTASEVGAGFTRIDVSSSASVSEVVTDLISVHGAITSG